MILFLYFNFNISLIGMEWKQKSQIEWNGQMEWNFDLRQWNGNKEMIETNWLILNLLLWWRCIQQIIVGGIAAASQQLNLLLVQLVSATHKASQAINFIFSFQFILYLLSLFGISWNYILALLSWFAAIHEMNAEQQTMRQHNRHWLLWPIPAKDAQLAGSKKEQS